MCSSDLYGPEQVAFLQYRPVLSNESLKRDFGFVPTKTSREVFEIWWSARQAVIQTTGAHPPARTSP